MSAEPNANALRFVASFAARWTRWLADLVYPPVCPGCGVSTGAHGGFCPACWREIRFIERPYCDVLGLPFSYDPGQGMLSAEAIANPPVFDRLRSAAIFEGPARELVHSLKYRDRTDLAPMMAGMMLRAAEGHVANSDGILPVPLHRSRFASRKFNQAAELGRHLAQKSGRPFLPSTLVRVKRTSRQVGLSARAREDNVRAAFRVAPGHEADVFGKRLVLVDDVFTTGATVSSATRALKKAGAAEVTVLTFAMAVSGPI
ncbi:ComF family protein [Rhizobium petrolearium]|uniref:ComF family protein n=1 Tax=Neorhizobium petrolearium TaxID=515361 RepID=UPI001AEAC2E2|nr:ComF family protein [Neorhizobium petrolearium]MBP1845283.1 ComF family protein [Neorhizobium petrolearium]